MAAKNKPFTLRKFEKALPIMKSVEKQDAGAYSKLLAIILADDLTIKLSDTNPDALQPFLDAAYELDPMEGAERMGFFIAAAQSYSMLMSGLPKEVVQKMDREKLTRVTRLLEKSPEQPVE
jgi:hypothetical protein